MKKRSLYIIVAVVLIAGLILSFTDLTGNFLNPNSQLGQCIDSDDGEDAFIPGNVRYTKNNAVYKDECYSEGNVGAKKYLRERYCFGGAMQNRLYLCLSGCLENFNGEGYCEAGEINRINTKT